MWKSPAYLPRADSLNAKACSRKWKIKYFFERTVLCFRGETEHRFSIHKTIKGNLPDEITEIRRSTFKMSAFSLEVKA